MVWNGTDIYFADFLSDWKPKKKNVIITVSTLDQQECISPLPDDEILNWSNLKAFADDS